MPTSAAVRPACSRGQTSASGSAGAPHALRTSLRSRFRRGPSHRAWLRETDVPLAAIARRVGYSTEFAFGAAFRREYGIAPGRFRADAGQRPPPRPRNVAR
ncbi:helix-turn-helix domain-containing protein [Catenuloplanes sp. NPDC051500]|uniref:helix-turn-helix domain-containing protein n=1 Tax=Catenuloplanes sp. NPDC051500 TaxID=3363959 RepID=UPI0037A2E955